MSNMWCDQISFKTGQYYDTTVGHSVCSHFLCGISCSMYDCRMMFVFKMGKDGRETFKMLKVTFGEHTVERTQVLECFSKFRSGVTSVEMWTN